MTPTQEASKQGAIHSLETPPLVGRQASLKTNSIDSQGGMGADISEQCLPQDWAGKQAQLILKIGKSVLST